MNIIPENLEKHSQSSSPEPARPTQTYDGLKKEHRELLARLETQPIKEDEEEDKRHKAILESIRNMADGILDSSDTARVRAHRQKAIENLVAELGKTKRGQLHTRLNNLEAAMDRAREEIERIHSISHTPQD